MLKARVLRPIWSLWQALLLLRRCLASSVDELENSALSMTATDISRGLASCWDGKYYRRVSLIERYRYHRGAR
ncbi:hypothetical protein KCP75_11215 [Salmonella enterica subsp. enterica]|nr:hypothetical protein KCP75_11215 [Salmonella enterica subsp. enterica]